MPSAKLQLGKEKTMDNTFSYIQEIRSKLSDEAWIELNWYLLHHDDMSIREAYDLYRNDDPKYTNWIIQNNIMDVDKDRSIKEILLAFVQDYLDVYNDDGNINVQEYFKEREKIRDQMIKR